MPLIPDQEQIEYMLAHAGDNLAPQIIISSSICGPLVLLFLCLRLFSRRLVGVWVLSDWLIIIAFVRLLTATGLMHVTNLGQDLLRCMEYFLELLNTLWSRETHRLRRRPAHALHRKFTFHDRPTIEDKLTLTPPHSCSSVLRSSTSEQ